MWNAEQQIFNLNNISVYRAVNRVPGQKSSRSSAGTTNPIPKVYRDNLGRQPMSIDGKSPISVAQAAVRGAQMTGNYRDNRKSSLSSIASSSSASSASGSPSLQRLQQQTPLPTPVASPSIGKNSLSQVRSPSFGTRPTPVLPQSIGPVPTSSTARPTPIPTPSTARPTPIPTPSTVGSAYPPAAQMQLPPPHAAPSLRRRTMVPAARMPPPPTPPTPSPPTTPPHQIISPYVPSPPSTVSGSSPPSQYVSAVSSPLINQATPPTPLPQFNALNIREPRSSSL